MSGSASEPAKRRTSSSRRAPKSSPPAVARGSRRNTPTSRRPAKPDAPAAPAVPRSQKLQKVLAQAGLGSRRAMEEIIKAGKVKVNGAAATLGTRVTTDDLIQVGRRQIKFKVTSRLPRVIIYHKPEGEIVTRDDPQGRPSVFEKLPVIRSAKWLAIGRLDFNTGGLLIFTTSGELANRLMHPRFEVEREYAVRLFGALSPEHIAELKKGVRLSDGEAKFDLLEEQRGEGRNRWYRVILKEGRNRVVRRMFEALGLQVSRLMRVRFGLMTLPPRLKRGNWIELKETEISQLLEWAGSVPANLPANGQPDVAPNASKNAPTKVLADPKQAVKPAVARPSARTPVRHPPKSRAR